MNGMQPDRQPRAFPGDEADFTGSRIETAPVEADRDQRPRGR
jgi:hypothetical protein